MFLDGCNKVAGCILLAVGVILIAGGIIGGVLIPRLKDEAFMNLLVYDYDSKFEDINYEDCEDEYKNYFFYNITNVDEFLDGAKAHVELVGPYNYTRQYCVFGEREEGNERVFYEYTTAPEFVQIQGSQYTANDIIYNVNPAYLGILHQVAETAQTTDNLEYIFESNLAGPALAQVITGMQSATFVGQIVVGGMTAVFEGIRTAVAAQVAPVVRAQFSMMILNGYITYAVNVKNVSSAEGAGLVLNDISIPGGFAEYQGSNQTFSETETTAIFFGPAGLLSNARGMGVLNFYAGLPAALNSYIAAWGVDEATVLALHDWVVEIFELRVNGAVNPLSVTYYANLQFYGQWTNGTLDPNGLNINDDPQVPDGVELAYTDQNTVAPQNISESTCIQLWNESRADSFMNVNGIVTWMTAIQASQTNQSALAPLVASFGLSSAQITAIAQWLVRWQSQLALPLILDDFGLTNSSQLAYLQWGTAQVLDGASLKDYQPSLPAAPEFAIWAAANSIPFEFNATQSERILNGPLGLMIQGNIPVFFKLVQGNQFTLVSQYWGLTPQEAGAMAQYLNYFITSFIDTTLLYQIFPQGSGPVVGRTPTEWLWTAQDPLLEFIGEDPRVGAVFDENEAWTREEALNMEPTREEIFKGGNKEELLEFLRVKTFKGNDTVYGYREPFHVSGYPGDYWVPGSVKEDSILSVWFDELGRAINWQKTGEFDLKGIHLWKFEPVYEDVFLNDTANPDNGVYYQHVTGLLNITGINSFHTFISHGMWDLVEPTFRAQVDGLVYDDPYYATWMFGVEPESGITMVKFATKQVSFGYPTMNRFHANFTSGHIPVFFLDDYEDIPDEDADEYKSSIAMVKAAQIAFFVVGIVLGVILGALGVAILYRKHQHPSSKDNDNPLELNDIS